MLARSPEQRKTARRPARRAATVSFGENIPPITCVIWDISDGGARLAIARPMADIPRYFTLRPYKDGTIKWSCEVVWTDTRYVGVRFTSLVL
jgi:hypothetical protein